MITDLCFESISIKPMLGKKICAHIILGLYLYMSLSSLSSLSPNSLQTCLDSKHFLVTGAAPTFAHEFRFCSLLNPASNTLSVTRAGLVHQKLITFQPWLNRRREVFVYSVLSHRIQLTSEHNFERTVILVGLLCHRSGVGDPRIQHNSQQPQSSQ